MMIVMKQDATAEEVQAVIGRIESVGARAHPSRGDEVTVIGGDEPNAADFQIASSLLSLAKLGDLAPHLHDHPAVRWAGTLLPALPGPTPRALPAEWLGPLAALRTA